MGVSGERILLSTWTEWSSDTSVAGASNAGRANKSLPAKMIWMAIFVAGLVFTVLSLKSVIDTYLKYEVETTYKVEKYSRLSFPAVTICNQNRINCNLLKTSLDNCTEIFNDTSSYWLDSDSCPFSAQSGATLEVVLDKAKDVYNMSCINYNKEEEEAATTTNTGGTGSTGGSNGTADSNTNTTADSAGETNSNSDGTTATSGGDQQTAGAGDEANDSGSGGSEGAGSADAGGSESGNDNSATDAQTGTGSNGDSGSGSTAADSGSGAASNSDDSETESVTSTDSSTDAATDSTDSATETTTSDSSDSATEAAPDGSETDSTDSGSDPATNNAASGSDSATDSADSATDAGSDNTDSGSDVATDNSGTETAAPDSADSGSAAATGNTGDSAAPTDSGAQQAGRRRRKRQVPPLGGSSLTLSRPSHSPGGLGLSSSAPSQEAMGSIADDDLLKFASLFAFFSEDNRLAMGHKWDDLVQNCVYKQRNCKNESNFREFNSPSYGNCFTFNSAFNDDDPSGGFRASSLTGPDYGLAITFKSEQGTYMYQGFTKQGGVRVTIHRTDELPLMDEYGYNVKSATHTSLAIREETIKRLKSPYSSHCVDEWEETNYTQIVPKTTDGSGHFMDGWEYSVTRCARLCLLDYFQQTCNCTHPTYADDDTFKQKLPICEVDTEGSNYDCVNKVYDDLDKGLRECTQCKVDCYDLGYHVAMSHTEFPTDNYYSLAGKTYYDPTEEDSGDGSQASAEEGFIKDLGVVEIYFSSLDVHELSESPVYSSWYGSEFISALGGALSLYLGISLAMFFELMEFFIVLFKNVWGYALKGRKHSRPMA